MNFHETSCCAIQDICDLSRHASAKDAMIAFCQQALLNPPKFGNCNGKRDTIYSFYLFTAAVGRYYQPYGSNFYNFIKENGLGEVYESPKRPNKAWHPDHENQIYVWMPDLQALKAWWAENDPSKVKLIKPLAETKSRKKVVPEPGLIPEPIEKCPF